MVESWRLLLKTAHRCACALGLNCPKMVRALPRLARFIRDAAEYRRAHGGTENFKLSMLRLYPCLTDSQEAAGELGSYFWQDLWAGQKIYQARPVRHVDVGSRVDGFIAHLLCFMQVTVVEIRPLPVQIEGLLFVQDDATELRKFKDSSVDSLSSLNAVEHFGLGRYGDDVDPDAPFKAMRSFERVLRPGGVLYLSVPLGREVVEFNAHRIFAPATVLKSLPHLRLNSFAAVDDAGRYLTGISPETLSSARHALGLFEFVK